MPLLLPNWQRQSTEGNSLLKQCWQIDSRRAVFTDCKCSTLADKLSPTTSRAAQLSQFPAGARVTPQSTAACNLSTQDCATLSHRQQQLHCCPLHFTFYNCRYRYCNLQFVTVAFYCIYICTSFVHGCIWQLFLKNKRLISYWFHLLIHMNG